jgi:hypothetical protein
MACSVLNFTFTFCYHLYTGNLQLHTWNKPCLGYMVLQLFCSYNVWYVLKVLYFYHYQYYYYYYYYYYMSMLSYTVLGASVRSVFLKLYSEKGRQRNWETKIRNGIRVLFAVLNLYVPIRIRVATFDTNHSIADRTQTINRCISPEASWFCRQVSQHSSL